MISGLIKCLMNEAWSRKHGLLAGSYSPFNQLAIATPTVEKQAKADSSIYTCLFLDDDFYSNLILYATNRLVFATDEVSRLRLEMKSCILFSFGSSKYMNPGLKSIKQPPALSCSNRQLNHVYELSYSQRDGSRCARDPIVQLLLRQGNINEAVSEGLEIPCCLLNLRMILMVVLFKLMLLVLLPKITRLPKSKDLSS
jgi:hypothetical protein